MSNTNNIEANIYEVGYHVLPNASETDIANQMKAIEKILADNDASVVTSQTPELIELAYTISRRVTGAVRQDYDTAHFGWTKFEAKPEAIDAIDEALKAEINILRFIIVKTIDGDFTPFDLGEKSPSEDEGEDEDEDEASEKPKKMKKEEAEETPEEVVADEAPADKEETEA